MKRVAVLACIVGVGICAAMSSASTRPRWVPTVLGTLSFPGTYGIDSAAIAVNSRGEVLGESGFLSFHGTGSAPLQHAFVWRSGRMIDLGTLGGSITNGVAINDPGTAVGTSATHSGAMHAFLWRDGHMTDLGTLGGRSSAAVGINDRDQVIDWSDVSGSTAVGLHHAFVWERGRMTDLGTLGGAQSEPVDVNARGQIVGWSETDIPGDSHAFLWQNGKMTDLGARGGVLSTAIAINDRGRVGAEPSGHNSPNDSDVVPAMSIDPQGVEVAATLRRPDGHTRAIVWRRK